MRKRSGFGWLEFVIGVLLIVMGVFTFLRPNSAMTVVVVIYGLIAVLTGVSDIVFYTKMERHTGFGPTISLISGILSVMAGVMLVVYPNAGKWIMSLLFPIWFIAHCISRLSHLNVVRFMAGNVIYYFSMIMNVIGLILGIFMLIQPVVTLLTFGHIIGLYLILLGVDNIAMAVSQIGSKW